MFAIDAPGLLRVWEVQRHAHPVRRALHLLAASTPGADEPAWRHAPVGLRDGALLRLHAHLFGPALHTTARCPRCGERLESTFDVDAIGAPAEVDAEHVTSALSARWTLRRDGIDVDWRLPTSEDLLEVVETPGAAGLPPARALLRRCVEGAHRGTDALDPVALPDDLVAALDEEMARHDPEADVRASLECPACAATWEARFDVVAHLWAALDDWALRTLADVHELARAYGWSEDQILALSPARRQLYLDLVNG